MVNDDKSNNDLGEKTLTNFEVIRNAFERVGYDFVIKKSDGGYKYIFLCNKDVKSRFEKSDLDELIRVENYFEFEPNGSWRSY